MAIIMLKYLPFVLVILVNTVYSQYRGPIPAIGSGYGSPGTHTVSVATLANDWWAAKDIVLFYPAGSQAPVPTIFYSHGYASFDTLNHIHTLRHFAGRGYAVVFVPVNPLGTTNADKYATLFDGFAKAARTFTSIIDTTRVGFFGQSYGGGATPRVSYRAFSENNWGANGRFIYCSAPWYSYELGSGDLGNFPADCRMLTVLYDDDIVNDHRMGMDIFDAIAIDDSLKDCITVHSDMVSGYAYTADHTMPNTVVYDALDYYVTFRLLDALADYTFNGNPSGKDVALGNGSAAQVNMGGQLSPLSVDDTPSPAYAQTKYTFKCSDIMNLRRAYCRNHYAVELSGFHAVRYAEGVRLRWRVESETGALLFRIERGETEAGPFETVGTVAARGTATSPAEYEFMDAGPEISGLEEQLWYRLVEVDTDGNQTIFPAVSVRRSNAPKALTLTLFPQPLRSGANDLTVFCESPLEQRVVITLHDILGRQIMNPLQRELHEGSNVLLLGDAAFQPGSYMLVATFSDGSRQTRRIIAY